MSLSVTLAMAEDDVWNIETCSLKNSKVWLYFKNNSDTCAIQTIYNKSIDIHVWTLNLILTWPKFSVGLI